MSQLAEVLGNNQLQTFVEVSVAPKNGAVMAGRKGPAMWLRYGPLPAHRRQI
jgi:hypothetical protein